MTTVCLLTLKILEYNRFNCDSYSYRFALYTVTRNDINVKLAFPFNGVKYTNFYRIAVSLRNTCIASNDFHFRIGICYLAVIIFHFLISCLCRNSDPAGRKQPQIYIAKASFLSRPASC